jgi:ABC-type spermidine/putrescine transport system permease subunit I
VATREAPATDRPPGDAGPKLPLGRGARRASARARAWRPRWFWPAFVRTFVFVAAASALCLLLAYPVAYYVTRYAGRRKGLLLVALLAPFWVSYMMRMLAWVTSLSPTAW